MMELIVTPHFKRDWKRLGHAARLQIDAEVQSLVMNGLHGKDIRKLQHHPIATWRLRVGDYRVLFDIRGKAIVLHRTGHRKDIYRT